MKDEGNTRDAWRSRPPFSADREEKDVFFRQEMTRLTEYHRRSCQAYDDICHGLGYDHDKDVEGPYLPVSLFKDLQLRSVPEEEVIRQVTSSGTSGQRVSRIYLDAQTADLQRWALASITGDFIGSKRMPMLIIDSPQVLRDRRRFSARGSGILGFSMMSSKRFYALDENMELDMDSIQAFCQAAGDGPSFAFGFTFMIWQYLYRALKDSDQRIDLKGCYLIHGGGWKKLQEQSVSDEEFRRCLRERCGFKEISDYYGMAEQTGSIFMQCPQGHLHASIFSDIEILDPEDFRPCRTGQWGLVALRSWIPSSYPGHMLLTEDWGRILGEDDCPCGRKGKYFEIRGRIRKAEIRGCSDTFEAKSSVSDAAEGGLQVLAGQWPMPEWSGEHGSAEQSTDRSMDRSTDRGTDWNAGRSTDRSTNWRKEQRTGPFDPLVLSFLGELSERFMKETAYRQYPDIYALGFWLRPAHLKQMQKRQEASGVVRRNGDVGPQGGGLRDEGFRRARQRGLVLHIAPSNMPAMFAYSWITALLAGAPSVVRLSSREDPVSEAILQGIREVLDLPEYEVLRRSNAFLRFPRGHRALEEISRRCRARMIWGGDETVAKIMDIPKADGAIDIPFPDKYSIALLHQGVVSSMSDEELRMQAHLFCRDTYGADQNACSSPRSVFWLADPACPEDLQEVKQRWWDAVAAEAKRYDMQAFMATEKYRLLCCNYAQIPGLGAVRRWGNRLYVIPCGNPGGTAAQDQPLPEAKLGMFYEFDLSGLEQLYPLLGEKIQTMVCIGNEPEELLRCVREAGCAGVDRAVAAGEALEFDTIWDRKDLICMLAE